MQVCCPNCSKQTEVPDSLRGKNVFCTSCGNRIQAAGFSAEDKAWEVAASLG